MLSKKQQIVKRLFDISFSLVGLTFSVVPILVFIILATFSTKRFGLFFQERIGQYGQSFKMFKIRTMIFSDDINFITILDDVRITKFGKFARKYKLDELPQLFNVLIGSMSFVGPRPDVKGYADRLSGEDRIILSVKPGITGLATLKYRNEEELLAQKENPKKYNDTVIWKDKTKLNKAYIANWSFFGDIKIIIDTIFH